MVIRKMGLKIVIANLPWITWNSIKSRGSRLKGTFRKLLGN